MAFSFSNAVSGGGGFGGQVQSSGAVQVRDGPELREIQTDQLGFASINGDAKVQILPSPWPIDSLPPPTSSLLSVASSKGFLAAAGPDSLIFASTENVRSAFSAEGGSASNVKSLKPEVTISVPRLSQVAFSADENVLVVSPEDGGGLAAYQVDGLRNGRTEPALHISTNNIGLRGLIPNPATEYAELFAAITNNGELLVADLKSGQLKNGLGGPVLSTGVTCLSWSNRGKQLVAGLADGTATQMRPDGTVVTQIPKSTSISGDMHMSTISWLENDSFFTIYTSNDTTTDYLMPSSEYYIISRQPKSSEYTFQRLPEICPAFGLKRMPSSHFITRLRNFPPHLQDLLVLASTTSTDVGIISKTDAPLSKEEPVTGVFTLTTISEDARRAACPLSESQDDTSPIGMGIDLSSKDQVVAPIPSDPEIELSPTPLPNLLMLNHEGILVSWWIVYNESIREKTMFSGLAPASSSQDQMQTSSTPVQTTPAPLSTVTNTIGFGQAGFGSSTLSKPAATSFSTPAVSSGFATTSGPTFGTKSTIGGGTASWTSTGFGSNSASQSNNSTFGQPAFGSSTTIGGTAVPAFGAASSLTNRQTPFGQAPATSTPSFGQSGFGMRSGAAFGDMPSTSPFAATTGPSQSSGFATFSQTNALSGFASAKKDGENVFGQSAGGVFSTPQTSSIFGSKADGQSVFGRQNPNQTESFFGASGKGFKIQSSFKGDGSAKDDLPKPVNSGGLVFGGAFENVLGDTTRTALSPTHDTEAEMDEKEDDLPSDSQDESQQDHRRGLQNTASTSLEMVTPPSTIIQHKATPAPPLSNLFGTSNQAQTTPVTSQTAGAGWSFGNLPSTTPKDTPGPSHLNIFGSTNQSDSNSTAAPQRDTGKPLGVIASSASAISIPSNQQPFLSNDSHEAPHIKAEPPSDDEATNLHDIPEAPLPPEPRSKSSYSPGGTSASSNHSKLPDDAPLPPDFLPANKSAASKVDQPGLPEGDDDLSSDFEGSGEDVTEDISPIEEHSPDHTEQLLTSPESSFGRAEDKSNDGSPTGGVFTNINSPNPKRPIPRPLFGEVSTDPLFPPPKAQESPRSPSPIRNLISKDHLRQEAPRSFSAPTRPPALEKRKAELAKSSMAVQAAKEKEDRVAQEQAQNEARVRAQAKVEAEEAQELEDDEDERLRTELDAPVEPCANLGAFLPYQPVLSDEVSKSGIPGQIERLYQDINSMIITIGINARSLSAFMAYQQAHETDESLANILKSATPTNALDQEWLLDETFQLRAAETALNDALDLSKLSDVATKLQKCQDLVKEISDLRSKLLGMRRSLHVRSDPALTISAPLSPEQASMQQDLRKASTVAQTRLTQAEESLSVLRAKLTEVAPLYDKVLGTSGRGVRRSASQKKPTVEAVTNTVAKMTSMAEKKSADIDVLESHLKRLNIQLGDVVNGSREGSIEPNGTPQKSRMSGLARSIGSATNSVYHTPDSRFSGSVRSTPGTGRKGLKSSKNGSLAMVSAEDRQKWEVKAQRKREIAAMLKTALAQRRSNGQSAR